MLKPVSHCGRCFSVFVRRFDEVIPLLAARWQSMVLAEVNFFYPVFVKFPDVPLPTGV